MSGDCTAFSQVKLGLPVSKNLNATDRCLLHVYFDTHTSVLLVNDLVSNTVQLMSSFGGIFSLFLGCSFMSAVEVLYFFTVRLWLLVRGVGSAEMPSMTPARRVDESPPHLSPTTARNFGLRPRDDDWSGANPIRPRAF
ncbi:sodium channel protein Nach-like [Thrips palmi]|uniref:Sodium channel protein Nach-like n=1 Tax=Thrips palmi TaxID=161013 RepID=A0A6P8YRB2_THRPL|nr:sodium channel protein Nach-like [Thrips palmi]